MPPFPTRPKFGQQTPPAIFPSVFGSFGLGLAWRRAVDTFHMPTAPGEMILGAVTLLFLFCLLAYGLKVARRPGVLADDMRVLPGRGGQAAAIMALFLLASSLIPMSVSIATVLLIIGLAANVGLIVLYLRFLCTAPAEQRVVSPVWQLTFVGSLIGAMVAAQLGMTQLATVIYWINLPTAMAIWSISLLQLWRNRYPAPLRPFLAIHLAPACLSSIVALMLGLPGLSLGLACFAIAILAALLVKGLWLTEAGFSPAWSSFTFPLAAFSIMAQLQASAGHGEVFRILGGLGLVAATLIIPVITFKVMQAWAKGQLAVKTNAARA